MHAKDLLALPTAVVIWSTVQVHHLLWPVHEHITAVGVQNRRRRLKVAHIVVDVRDDPINPVDGAICVGLGDRNELRELRRAKGKGVMVFVYDHDGGRISEVEGAMRSAGFANVYYVSDGWVGLRAERGEEV